MASPGFGLMWQTVLLGWLGSNVAIVAIVALTTRVKKPRRQVVLTVRKAQPPGTAAQPATVVDAPEDQPVQAAKPVSARHPRQHPIGRHHPSHRPRDGRTRSIPPR